MIELPRGLAAQVVPMTLPVPASAGIRDRTRKTMPIEAVLRGLR